MRPRWATSATYAGCRWPGPTLSPYAGVSPCAWLSVTAASASLGASWPKVAPAIRSARPARRKLYEEGNPQRYRVACLDGVLLADNVLGRGGRPSGIVLDRPTSMKNKHPNPPAELLRRIERSFRFEQYLRFAGRLVCPKLLKVAQEAHTRCEAAGYEWDDVHGRWTYVGTGKARRHWWQCAGGNDPIPGDLTKK